MKVAVFGATGFIGSYLVDALVNRDHEPHVLVRQGSEKRLRHPEACAITSGDLEDRVAIRATINDSDAVIYNTGILREIPARNITFQKLHFEAAKRCMETAVECGTPRFILMSANGVRPDGTPYQKTKYMAEQFLATTDLQWTVFRPSVVFGDPRGRMEFATQLRNEIINSPLPMPIFHKGLIPLKASRFKLSPVHVSNVAEAFVRALDDASTIGKILPLGGPEELDWRSILLAIAHAVKKEKLAIPAPAWAVKLIASIFDQYEWFPVTADQISMLVEGNTCDATETMSVLQINSIPFNSDTLEYLNH